MRSTILPLLACLAGCVTAETAPAPPDGPIEADADPAVQQAPTTRPDEPQEDQPPRRSWTPPKFVPSASAAREAIEYVRAAGVDGADEPDADALVSLRHAIVVGTGFKADPNYITPMLMRVRGWGMLARFLESQGEWSLALDCWRRWEPDALGDGTYAWGSGMERRAGLERCRERLGR